MTAQKPLASAGSSWSEPTAFLEAPAAGCSCEARCACRDCSSSVANPCRPKRAAIHPYNSVQDLERQSVLGGGQDGHLEEGRCSPEGEVWGVRAPAARTRGPPRPHRSHRRQAGRREGEHRGERGESVLGKRSVDRRSARGGPCVGERRALERGSHSPHHPQRAARDWRHVHRGRW